MEPSDHSERASHLFVVNAIENTAAEYPNCVGYIDFIKHKATKEIWGVDYRPVTIGSPLTCLAYLTSVTIKIRICDEQRDDREQYT